ncbi:MAG: hypothetical protein Q9167_002878 [Letrouitia subvulpina]
MTAINKLLPGIANASLEVAPALAQLNFDFTLYKVEAPKEYEGVGSALTSFRREQAESGMPHATARKLGALFETCLPSTPDLTRAYGRRASEISKSSSISPEGRKSFGVFASRVGADATSLWAAATSGGGAIAVHLLACLLARIWEASEATSIWVEIVKCRKDEVISQFNQSDIGHLVTLSAAKQEITRSQIAEWDASARAWLRAADTVKTKQQKQLMLIIDNIAAPVNRKTNTYESVMEAWKSSLAQMEALVKGISQIAQDGEILLALSAWHLFPDINVAAPAVTLVRQHDSTFHSGGILTVGLQKPDQQHTGVYWSLPLAHLRYYGEPVVSARSMDSATRSRLSLTELLLATLGSLFYGWGEAGLDTLRAIDWFSGLLDILSREAKRGSDKACYHSYVVVQIPTIYRQIANKLISLGRRHGHDFLGLPPEPLFGMLTKGQFVTLFRNQHDTIKLLRKIGREVAQELRLESNQIYIRYRTLTPKLNHLPLLYEYTTAIPRVVQTLKRSNDSSRRERPVHRRWIRDSRGYYEVPLTEPERHGMSEYYLAKKDYYESLGEEVELWESEDIGYRPFQHESILSDQARPRGPGIEPGYRFLYGDQDYAALYVAEGQEKMINAIKTVGSAAEDFYYMFEAGQVAEEIVVNRLFRYFHDAKVDIDPHLRSLKALSSAATLYQNFSNASVDVCVLQMRLHAAAWLKTLITPSQLENHESAIQTYLSSNESPLPVLWLNESSSTPTSLLPYELSSAAAFACMTMFESGRFDVDPNQLSDVMAMSSGDSIYVITELLLDPWQQTRPGNIQRVVGNIGHPGITFLVPPKNPMIKKFSMNEWSFVGRNDFDGQFQDNFQCTSLHLSFTGAETLFNTGFSGSQDAEVFILEALVRVYDGGRWIADLNVPMSMASTKLRRIQQCQGQHGDSPFPTTHHIMCLDSWHALIERPEDNLCLVRAYKNWQARLAATCLCTAMGYETVVVPANACWQCFKDQVPAHIRHVMIIG